MPEDSIYPALLTAALMLTFYGLLLSRWALGAFGLVCVIAMVIGWLWPEDPVEVAP
jgi:hypothetical protein